MDAASYGAPRVLCIAPPPSSGERFASRGDIFYCRGSSILVDCIFVLVRI